MLILLALLGGLLAGWLVALGTHRRRLVKHDIWLERLDIALDNLHRERKRNYVQSLQVPSSGRKTLQTRGPVPPGTIEVQDADLIINDEKKKPP